MCLLDKLLPKIQRRNGGRAKQGEGGGRAPRGQSWGALSKQGYGSDKGKDEEVAG